MASTKCNLLKKRGFNMGKIALGILVIVIALLGISYCKKKNYYYNKKNYIQLNELAIEPYTGEHITWGIIRNKKEAGRFTEIYGIKIPDKNFEKKMIIVSLGSSIDTLYFREKSKKHNFRNKYVGIVKFKDNINSQKAHVYETDKADIIDTDEALLPPDYE